MKPQYNLLITGGSGYLGSALTNYLSKENLTIVSHETTESSNTKNTELTSNVAITWVSRNSQTSCPKGVSIMTYDELKNTNKVFDIIINLAGAGIADKRWTDKRKKELYNSRLNPTQAVIDYIERIAVKPKLFVSGSAIGWYGVQDINDNTKLTENSNHLHSDFAHELCEKWESLAHSATEFEVNVVIIRTGVVLSSQGGMIAKLKQPFSMGLGGNLGDGKQVMSWISLRDWTRAVFFIMNHHMSEPNSSKEMAQIVSKTSSIPDKEIYNLTAPNPVTNRQFTSAVGEWLNRPTVFAQPNMVVKMIFGEMATLLINGQNVYPQKLLDMNFQFTDNTVGEALNCET